MSQLYVSRLYVSRLYVSRLYVSQLYVSRLYVSHLYVSVATHQYVVALVSAGPQFALASLSPEDTRRHSTESTSTRSLHIRAFN